MPDQLTPTQQDKVADIVRKHIEAMRIELLKELELEIKRNLKL